MADLSSRLLLTLRTQHVRHAAHDESMEKVGITLPSHMITCTLFMRAQVISSRISFGVSAAIDTLVSVTWGAHLNDVSVEFCLRAAAKAAGPSGVA